MDIEEIKRNLIIKIERLVEIIRNEYPDLVDLSEDYDLEQRVHIEDTGTISLFVKDKNFYFPLSAFEVIDSLKRNPMYGSDKDHKTHTEDNMVINDNTFQDFINHIIVKGLTPEEYYNEIVLYETFHFCGSGGGTAIREGINELKTRQLAKKYNLETSCCGYPKETKIAYDLEQIFGEDVINKISFSKKQSEIRETLDRVSSDAYDFYFNVERTMEREFYDKYMKHKFPGPNGPYEKMQKYNEIDYSNVHELISEYKTKHGLTSSIIEENNTQSKAENQKKKSESFNYRSQTEISIAQQIRLKNQMIAKQKQAQQNQINKSKTLVKKVDSNQGYVNFIILSLILGVLLSVLTIIIKIV